jgi:hypothetical protein
MEQALELKALRDIREITISIRELEAQASVVSKRYKKGIKMLETEILSIEQTLDEGAEGFDNMKPWDIRTEDLKRLISDPGLVNIPEDNLV